MVGPSDVAAAQERIADRIRRTPTLDLGPGAFGVDARLICKLEGHQVAGSFKTRGAVNRLSRLPKGVDRVVAASGGNHGAAVAFAANAMGLRAEIFVPRISSPAKRRLIEAAGARLEIVGDVYAETAAAAAARAAETGAPDIHAYDHPDTIAGQGTVAWEFEADAGPLDAVLAAVGGGGLIAGVAAWYGARTDVIAVEPEQSQAFAAARAAGGPVDVSVSGVAADSLGARRIGDLSYAIAAPQVADSVVVADQAIRAAQQWLWREARIAAEPAAAAPLAALISGAYAPRPGARVGLVVCGANFDPAALSAPVDDAS